MRTTPPKNSLAAHPLFIAFIGKYEDEKQTIIDYAKSSKAAILEAKKDLELIDDEFWAKAAQIVAPTHNDELMDMLCSPDTSNHALAFSQLPHGDNAAKFFEALIPKIQCCLDIYNLIAPLSKAAQWAFLGEKDETIFHVCKEFLGLQYFPEDGIFHCNFTTGSMNPFESFYCTPMAYFRYNYNDNPLDGFILRYFPYEYARPYHKTEVIPSVCYPDITHFAPIIEAIKQNH